MEFGATSPGDLYAGYVVEDSDLEYSGCSDDERLVSSDRIDGRLAVKMVYLSQLCRKGRIPFLVKHARSQTWTNTCAGYLFNGGVEVEG